MTTVYPTQNVTSSAGLKTSTTALAANAARISWQIQNQATAVLYLKFGAGCSTSDYDVVLKVCSGAADGTGGFYSQNGSVVYTGIVSVAAAGTPSYTCSDWAP